MSAQAFSLLLADLYATEGALVENDNGFAALTALGRRIVAGDADWLEHRRIDRWIGGVRLHGDSIARWDDDAGRFA